MSNSKPQQVCKPTVSDLYYVLGNLKARWERIGRSLKVPGHKLDAIKTDFRRCHRQMIEVFECWIKSNLEKDCNWSTIVKALNDIGQENLAMMVQEYTHDHLGVRFQHPHWLKKNFQVKCEVIEEAHLGQIEECLATCNCDYNCWYEIGCLLNLKAAVLDEIEKSDHVSDRLIKMVEKLRIKRCTWRELIFVLKELDLVRAAELIEELAEEQEIPKRDIEFEPEKRRANFKPEDERKECQDICNSLKLTPGETSDDEILDNLYANITEKKPNEAELKVIAKTLKRATEKTIERMGDLEVSAKEYEEDIKLAEKIRNKLMRELENKTKELANEQKKITFNKTAKKC